MGASGYTGGELLRLLAGHPQVTVTAVTSEKSVGVHVSTLFPNLASFFPLTFEPVDPDAIVPRADVVLLALPHTKSLVPVARCLEAGKPVIDLSADYRLKNASTYEKWYQQPHPYPALLEQAVYGLPELYRTDIQKARLVAAPGCYPTAAILQLAPLVAHGVIDQKTIVIDAKSGISGAGRSPALPYHFPEAHDSVKAYKIGGHRHLPEIEQELQHVAIRVNRQKTADVPVPSSVTFTPHLMPMNRGMLSTAYGQLRTSMPATELQALFKEFYKGERFIRIHDDSMAISPTHVRGSNFCDIGVFTDRRTNQAITVAALDNLVKGAAGQAIQAMNVMLGFPDDMGLTTPALYP